MSLIDRMQKATDINEKKYDLTDKERLHNILVEFTYFSKKVLPQMKTLKKAIEGFRQVKTSTIASYKVFQTLVNKYEDLNLRAYVDGEEENLVFNNPSASTPIKEQMDHMVDNLKNPFEEMYHWCKGEIYDL